MTRSRHHLCTGFLLVCAFMIGYMTHLWRESLVTPDLAAQHQFASIDCSTANIQHQLAKQIFAVLRHLTKAHRYIRNNAKAAIEIREAIGILAAVAQLSDEVLVAPENGNDSVASSTPISPTVVEVCPEKWLGNTAGYPFYFEGHVRENCTNAPPLESLLTIVLNAAQSTRAEDLSLLLRDLAQTYPNISIVVGLSTDDKENSALEEQARKVGIRGAVSVFMHAAAEVEGAFWKRLVAAVTTKYAFVGRNLVRFLPDSRLERLLDMAGHLHADVVGGSHRNESGHWSIGCFQTAMRNFAFRLAEGYDFSMNTCALCDHLSSPFLALTSLLKSAFDASLSSEALFVDVFVSLRNASETANFVSCPDVMFVTNERRLGETSRDALKQFARKWELNRIILPQGGPTHKYTCDEANVRCSWLKGIAMPLCCLDELSDMTRQLMRVCVAHGVGCELEGGTVVGAYKFNGLLPWERDADINWRSGNYRAMLSAKGEFRARGYRLIDESTPVKLSNPRQAKCFRPVNFTDTDINCGYFALRSSNWRIECWGVIYRASDVYLRHRFGLNDTLALFDGEWMATYPNPVWFSRNLYGGDVLGHIEHWITLGFDTGWKVYPESSFLPCPRKGYHGCLDQFLPTGSLQFMETWI